MTIDGNKNPLVRIASASGSVTDRRHAFLNLARDEDNVQFIVGDWMSEYNMTTRGEAKVQSNGSSSEFEISFLEALEPALPHLQSRGIKVAVNAGASDTEKLYHIVTDKIKAAGLDLQVAWVGGDEVLGEVQKRIKADEDFKSLTNGTSCKDQDNLQHNNIVQANTSKNGDWSPFTPNATWAVGASSRLSSKALILSCAVALPMRQP